MLSELGSARPLLLGLWVGLLTDGVVSCLIMTFDEDILSFVRLPIGGVLFTIGCMGGDIRLLESEAMEIG